MTHTAVIAERLQRIPKIALFGVASVLQLALLAVMVSDRVQILRDGVEVTLQTRPVDPRDLLRGEYVRLDYDISELPAGALKDQPSGGRNPIVYVKLAPKAEGLYQAVSVHTQAIPVQAPEVLIRGRIIYGAACGKNTNVFCPNLRVGYDLERYFVPEGEGRELERNRDKRKLTVVAAVLPSGRAAIKRLMIDGKPIHEEPWF